MNTAMLRKKKNSVNKKRLIDIVSRFENANVLVVGDFILDEYIWGDVRRISPEAPVPVVDVRRETFLPGGSLNVANNIHSLGGKVYPCGVVGRDMRGRMLLKAMRQQRIDTGGVVYDNTRPTTLKTRVIAHSQQVVRFDREKVHEISRKDLNNILKFIKDAASESDVLIIEDYGKGVVTPKLIKEIIRIAKKQKLKVIVDPKEKHFSYYKGVTSITPNLKEAMSAVKNIFSLDKMPTLESTGRKLRSYLKAESVLITLGEEGMALFEKNGRISRIPTAAREVFDVSGAGDTVIATFSLALACGASLYEAAYISNLAAGIVVGKVGAATSTLVELKNAVEEGL